jgi:hypothetical protein
MKQLKNNYNDDFSLRQSNTKRQVKISPYARKDKFRTEVRKLPFDNLPATTNSTIERSQNEVRKLTYSRVRLLS